MEQDPQQHESGDIAKIWRGMAEAELADRNIDDRTARLIASQLHTGQASAIYSLASTGAVDYLGVASELLRDYPDLDDETKRMVNHLGTYAVEHQGRGPIDGWYRLTEDQDYA